MGELGFSDGTQVLRPVGSVTYAAFDIDAANDIVRFMRIHAQIERELTASRAIQPIFPLATRLPGIDQACVVTFLEISDGRLVPNLQRPPLPGHRLRYLQLSEDSGSNIDLQRKGCGGHGALRLVTERDEYYGDFQDLLAHAIGVLE